MVWGDNPPALFLDYITSIILYHIRLTIKCCNVFNETKISVSYNQMKMIGYTGQERL